MAIDLDNSYRNFDRNDTRREKLRKTFHESISKFQNDEISQSIFINNVYDSLYNSVALGEIHDSHSKASTIKPENEVAVKKEQGKRRQWINI